MRSRYLYGSLLILTVVVLATWFVYKTKTPFMQPVERLSSTVLLSPPTATAEFGGVSLNIDFATTTASRERGLSGRTSIASNYGMLFVFPKDDLYGFWMKDTLVPLDMFWLDDKGQVVFIAHDVATSTYPHVFYPTTPALYVLETASGFARAHSITIGTPLQLKNFPTVTQ